MKDVELNEMDQEKQPMTGETPTGNEKNGCVKVTVPEDGGAKYTGLSKEELIKVAGTAGWKRIRWTLLVLFWLGWVGMLAGAIVLIIQAPKCKPIPEMNWWNEGPLYQISDVNHFTDKGLKGVEEKLDYLIQMKMKGLILGPIHTVQADELKTLNLTSIDPKVGTEKELTTLLNRAHKKGISVVLDLTPNYKGHPDKVWFDDNVTVAEDLRVACGHWLKKGFDGTLFSVSTGIAKRKEGLPASFNNTDNIKKTALMGSVTGLPANEVSLFLNNSGVDLLLTGLPDPAESGENQAQAVQRLYSSHQQTSLAWSLSGRTLGPLASRSPAVPIRLYHTLLFTLPGTPVFNAGDEIGLKNGEKPQIMWDLENPAEETNATAETLREERRAVRDFFKTLSDLKVRERALLHGEYVHLHSSTSSLAFLRLWDQSERFLTAINWGNDPVTMKLTNSDLPAQAMVRVSTDADNLSVGSMVPLENLQLGPKQAVLLSYPFAG